VQLILVTGATGHVGSHVARLLRERGATVRAFVRDRDRAAARLDAGIELAVGDFEDRASLRAALAGTDTLFLASANHPRQAEHEMTSIDAARDAAVTRIVKLSAIGAETGSPLSFWDQHGRIEEHLQRTGLPAVVLRPSGYMQYLLASADQIRQHGALFAPLAGAANALIDTRDVAAAAVIALTTNAHVGQTYVLTGPELLTYDRIAAEIGSAVGRPVVFVPVSDDDARQAMRASGMPSWLAEQLVIMMRLQRGGAAAAVTDTVRRLTGREPRSWRDFVRENAAFFRDPRAPVAST
jgi:uncharacterized protein YbjT (DUF2867 family)